MILNHFPFSYTGEFIVQKTEEQNQHKLENRFNSFFSNNIDITESKKTIYPPFIRIALQLSIDLNEDYDTIKIRYRLSLFELNIILLIASLFCLFFIYFSSTFIAITIICLALVYYIHTISFVSNSIKKVVYSNNRVNDSLQNLSLWEKQKLWLNDEKLCPACGEPINIYSNKCTNCGLYHNKRKVNFDNSNSTSNSVEIKYDVKKEQKNRS